MTVLHAKTLQCEFVSNEDQGIACLQFASGCCRWAVSAQSGYSGLVRLRGVVLGITATVSYT